MSIVEHSAHVEPWYSVSMTLGSTLLKATPKSQTSSTATRRPHPEPKPQLASKEAV